MSAISEAASPAHVPPAQPSSPAVPRRDAGAPPWLLFWTVLFCISLIPLWRENWRRMTRTYAAQSSYDARMAELGKPPHWERYLSYPGYVMDFLPSAGLALGIVAAAFPWLRARYVEARFGLKAPEASAVIDEITRFVHRHAPALRIRTNLRRVKQLAFVYPCGYRNSTLGLFGGMVMMWHADREAAQAVLLHEVAHQSRGDALFLGAGSTLAFVVKWVLAYFLVLCMLPIAVQLAVQEYRSYRESMDLYQALNAFHQERLAALPPDVRSRMQSEGHLKPPTKPSGARQWKQFFAFSLPAMLLSTIGHFFFYVMSPLVIPVAAIWVAELSADRAVVCQSGSADGVKRGLQGLVHRRRWWSVLMFPLTHPPGFLRRRALEWRGAGGLVFLLLLLPLAYIAKMLCLHVWAISTYVGFMLGDWWVGDPQRWQWPVIWRNTVENSALYFAGTRWVFAAAAALLLLWPLICPHWERFFGGGARLDSIRRPRMAGNAVAALLVAAMAAAGFVLHG